MVERIVRACSRFGKREVVDVARGAGDLLDAFLAEDVAADRLASRAPSRRLYGRARVTPIFRSRRSMMPTTAASSALSAARDLASRDAPRACSVSIVAPSR